MLICVMMQQLESVAGEDELDYVCRLWERLEDAYDLCRRDLMMLKLMRSDAGLVI